MQFTYNISFAILLSFFIKFGRKNIKPLKDIMQIKKKFENFDNWAKHRAFIILNTTRIQ